jgi:hypothetical protein
LDPQYGCILTINNELISDEAIVTKNGAYAIAYVWSDEEFETFHDEFGQAHQVPREPGNEVVAELESVTEEKGGKLMGVDKKTGQPTTWLVQESTRRCRGCS